MAQLKFGGIPPMDARWFGISISLLIFYISFQAQKSEYHSNSTMAFLAPIGIITACVLFSIV